MASTAKECLQEALDISVLFATLLDDFLLAILANNELQTMPTLETNLDTIDTAIATFSTHVETVAD